MVYGRLHLGIFNNNVSSLDRNYIMELELKDYQLKIIKRGLSVLLSNYDSYDLDDLMYSDLELESEIGLIQKSISKHLCVKEV